MALDPVLASSLAPESSRSTQIPNKFLASSITEPLLGHGDRAQLRERWGEAALLELESLARETDPEIFGADLLRLGLPPRLAGAEPRSSGIGGKATPA